MNTVKRPPLPRRQKGKTLDQRGLQEAVDSSPDALTKGTGQFFTPTEFANIFALPLTHHRRVIYDPHCGRHALLNTARRANTLHMLGSDLDARSRSSAVRTIIGDIGKIHPLMRQVDLRFDLIVMNPPFGLRWPAPTVRQRHRRPTRAIDGVLMMDSVQASWLMALDRLSDAGEGYMIAPQPIVEKLIQPCPTYSRVWAHVTLPQFFPGVRDERKMGVLYFAADHDNRGRPLRVDIESKAARAAEGKFRRIATQRNLWLKNTNRIDPGTKYLQTHNTHELFETVRAEWIERNKGNRPQFNLWLDGNGRINTYLSSFEEESRRISRELARSLHNLNGKRPLEMVLTKSDRLALNFVVKECGWKVDPLLTKAVEQAVAEYHRSRIPFNKPTLAMRVAWAEEEDRLTALNDWETFKSGETYELFSYTYEGRKIELRDHPDYGTEEVFVTGQEILLCLHDRDGTIYGFTQHPVERGKTPDPADGIDETERTLNRVHRFFSLGELMKNFQMPKIPDISEACPDLYRENLRKLKALETQ